ncbi:MAG: hypothetical protein ACR2MQ_03975 [Gemmatimonadaceae bacterium]
MKLGTGAPFGWSAMALRCVLGMALLGGRAEGQRAPAVDVWFENGGDLVAGDRAPVYYAAAPGWYVTVVRASPEGEFSVMASSQGAVRPASTGVGDQVLSFRAEPADGVGYVFAIASRRPFNFGRYRAADGRWDLSALGEAGGGADPFAVADRFARAITRRGWDYTVAYAPYTVAREGASGHHGVIFDPGFGYGYGGDGAYQSYGSYDGNGDRWSSSPVRRRFDRDRRSRYNADPRARYGRHCADGTLVPYTRACRDN